MENMIVLGDEKAIAALRCVFSKIDRALCWGTSHGLNCCSSGAVRRPGQEEGVSQVRLSPEAFWDYLKLGKIRE